MANPFKGMNNPPSDGGNDPRFMQMINGITRFGNQFQGDPVQRVQQMMNSGQMSQQQYSQLRGIAEQIAKFFPNK